ncbi:hypothetical protein GCM10010520_47840 [Rhizobium viscosum]
MCSHLWHEIFRVGWSGVPFSPAVVRRTGRGPWLDPRWREGDVDYFERRQNYSENGWQIESRCGTGLDASKAKWMAE